MKMLMIGGEDQGPASQDHGRSERIHYDFPLDSKINIERKKVNFQEILTV